MNTTLIPVKKMLAVLISGAFLLLVLALQGCKKEDRMVSSADPAANAKMKKGGNGGNPNNPPPPPPPAFYFTNCNSPTYTAGFQAGVPVNMTFTKNYVNSPGGSYPAFTSATVNGITITAPAGTFNVGSGSVVFTVTGTPGSTGFLNIWIGVGNIQQCMAFFYVTNPPVSGPTADPGPAFGSTGIVNFTYKGQAVAYKTVRAKDNKIWLQQNLGSPQVAFHEHDFASFGDYFQWGRWDDGHQSPNSPVITGGTALMNPSHIPGGNPGFISGATSGTRWWGEGGTASDTWSGTTPTATNGKDPCAALGAGWRMPTVADWQGLKAVEDLEGSTAAFTSNLKLPIAGYRGIQDGISYYWTGTAAASSNAQAITFDNNTYAAAIGAAYRANGYSCRCVKD